MFQLQNVSFEGFRIENWSNSKQQQKKLILMREKIKADVFSVHNESIK